MVPTPRLTSVGKVEPYHAPRLSGVPVVLRLQANQRNKTRG
jgi:hypothetical protein